MTASRRVLITGATSKLGINLVARLLQKTDADIWILVRKLPHARDPLKRIELSFELQNSNIRLRDYPGRVHVVTGDISKRNLGVSDSQFEELKTARIQEIFHLAAFTDRRSFTKDNLLSVNYEGTSRLLRFGKLLGASVFNHLGWLYSSQGSLGPASGAENYLDYLDQASDFNNISEFVHRMTTGLVVTKAASLGMAYRIVEPGYLIDLENHQKISHRWFYYVFRSVFDVAYAYRKLGAKTPTRVRFPAADVPIFLTTPAVVSDFLVGVYLKGQSSLGQVYQVFNAKVSVRDLLRMISKEFPGVELEFAVDKKELPLLERQIFRRSFIFFEYLMKHKRFMPDPKVHQIAEDFKINSPIFDEAAFRALARSCLNIYRLDSEKIALPFAFHSLLKAQFLGRRFVKRLNLRSAAS